MMGTRAPPGLPDAMGGLDPVHHRHLDIHEHAVERFPGKSGQGFLAVGGLDHDAAELFEQAPFTDPVDHVILDQQHPPAPGGVGRQRDRLFLSGRVRIGQGQGEHEINRRTLALLAVEDQGSFHEVGQTLADGQPQSRPLLLAGVGAVDLGEGLAHQTDLVIGDADAGIGHGEKKPDASIGTGGQKLGLDPDFAVFGELHGVADQIEQDLAHPQLVTDHRFRHVRPGPADQGQPLVPGQGGEGLDDGGQHGPGPKRG